MARFTREQKIIFANHFYITQDGRKSLEVAGIDPSVENLQKLLSDKSLASYLDKYSEVLEVMQARTKEAHTARLEELFDKATGKKAINDWEEKDVQIKKINYNAAIRLSERLETLKEWGSTENNVDVVLELGTLENQQQETEAEREEEVERALKKDGVL